MMSMAGYGQIPERHAAITRVANGYVVVSGGGDTVGDPMMAGVQSLVTNISAMRNAGGGIDPDKILEGVGKAASAAEDKRKLRRGGTYVFKDIAGALDYAKEWLTTGPKPEEDV